MKPIWHLRLLGSLAAEPVANPSETIVRFRTMKAAALLAYLAVQGQPQPRETLIALLWPEVPPEAARNSLSVALSSLRHQMEPPGIATGTVFLTDRATIGLRSGVVTTDVAGFLTAERAAHSPVASFEERRLRLQQAAERYTGPFLPGFYEDWVLAQRQFLGNLFSQIISDLISMLSPVEASDWLRRAALRDPDQTTAYADAMPNRALRGPGGSTSNALPTVAAESDSPKVSPGGTNTVTIVATSEVGITPESVTVSLHRYNGTALSNHLFAFTSASEGLNFAVACTRLTTEPGALAVQTSETGGENVAALGPQDSARALLDFVAPGRIVCGEATAALARVDLPAEIQLWDTGSWYLQPGRVSERLFEVRTTGSSPQEGAAIIGASRTPGDSLPLAPTRFFGREAEQTQIRTLLSEARLVTLLGLGGLGKTRLALETVRPYAEAGEAVSFVSLVESTHGEQIVGAIRAALHLGFPVASGKDEEENVIQALRQQPTLLVLDNLEQMGDSAAEPISHLLQAVPSLRILATSRRALNLPGECLVPIAPLPLDQGQTDPVELLRTSPAVALFCDRARSVLPDFQLTGRNAAAVTALCRRLDGIPLALELAASRARVLTPGQWLERLEKGLDAVATTARAGVPERHRTLLTTLRWSYDLLPPQVQGFFRKLALFHGGWSLDAAEAITGDALALDHLAVLGENSLIGSEPTRDGLRFGMLETIREFAASLATDELKALRQRYYDFFHESAAQYAPHLRTGTEQVQARDWFEAEQDNLRVALAGMEAEASDTMLPLAANLGRFWEIRGNYSEANQTLEPVLAYPLSQTPENRDARSTIHMVLGNIAHNQGKFDLATTHLQASLRLREESGDDQGAAMALNNLSLIAAQQSDFTAAQELTERAMAAHRRAGNEADAAVSEVNLANLYGYRGDWAEAERLYRGTVPVLKANQNERALGAVYANLCACAANRGDLQEAENWARDSVALKEAQGDRFGLAQSLDTLMEVLYLSGNPAEAWQHLRRSIRLLQETAAWRTLPVSLIHGAQLDRENNPVRAVWFLGAAMRINREDCMTFPPHVQSDVDNLEAALRGVLGEARYIAERTAGECLERQEAVALALHE